MERQLASWLVRGVCGKKKVWYWIDRNKWPGRDENIRGIDRAAAVGKWPCLCVMVPKAFPCGAAGGCS